MKNEKDILRIKIAAVKLYKFFPDLSIQTSENGYYDLFATDKVSGFKFGVKVGSSKMLSTNEYEEYFDKLRQVAADSIDCPIVAMSVNESSEEVKIGIITKIGIGETKLFRMPQMVVINTANARILYDNIKAMDSVIRALDSSNCGIVKQLTISVPLGNGVEEVANAIYVRPFTDVYKMRATETVTEKERFERYVYGIPENEYPSDILDEVILKGMTEEYPHAAIATRSSLLLFSTDLENLRREVENSGEPKLQTFQIEPNIEEEIIRNGFFTALRYRIDLYPCNPRSQYWTNTTTIVSLDKNQWKDFNDKYKLGLLKATNVSQLTL